MIADAALLTRMLTSLAADALHRRPAAAPPALTAAITGSNVTICVTDHGPRPDQGNGDGSSLALRLARDLAEAMGDTFRGDQAPDGGQRGHHAARRKPPAGSPSPRPSLVTSYPPADRALTRSSRVVPPGTRPGGTTLRAGQGRTGTSASALSWAMRKTPEVSSWRGSAAGTGRTALSTPWYRP